MIITRGDHINKKTCEWIMIHIHPSVNHPNAYAPTFNNNKAEVTDEWKPMGYRRARMVHSESRTDDPSHSIILEKNKPGEDFEKSAQSNLPFFNSDFKIRNLNEKNRRLNRVSTHIELS